MRYLLDTHCFLWFINGDKQLSPYLRGQVTNIENRCFLSIASVWEIAIKISIGKLSLESSFDNIAIFLQENDIELLPISLNHLQKLMDLEFHHRDPFDRIIIAQALSENLTLISKDDHFSVYNVSLLK